MQPVKPSQLPIHLGGRMCETLGLRLRPSQAPPSTPTGSEDPEDTMAEEMLNTMNLAASKFQALWRGYCARKQLCIEQGAAILLQSLWRGHRVRRLLLGPVSRPLRIQYSCWPAGRARSLEPPQRLVNMGRQQCHNLLHRQQEDIDQLVQLPIKQCPRRPGNQRLSSLQRKILAATTIQAYWRGYMVRRDAAVRIGAAVFIQAFYRGYLARRKLRPDTGPNTEPQDEESDMVSFNTSRSLGFHGWHSTAPGCPPSSTGHFHTAAGHHRPSSSAARPSGKPTYLHPDNQHSSSAKGDALHPSKARALPSWSPDSGPDNDSLEPVGMAGTPKPGYFIEGAGDTMSVGGCCSAAQSPASPAGGLRDKCLDELQWERWQRQRLCECAVRALQQTAPPVPAAGAADTYPNSDRGQAGAQAARPVSQYLVQSAPCSPGGPRKLIRYGEDPSSHSCRTYRLNRPSKTPDQLLDIHLTDLEVARGPSTCPAPSPPRKSLKQMREESAAARAIQAVWKGYCTRRSLRELSRAATKIQATYRSYRTRKDFEREGIFPLVSGKAGSKGVRGANDSPTSAVCRQMDVQLPRRTERPRGNPPCFMPISVPRGSPRLPQPLARNLQTAPCPQETRHPAPCPQETRHPAPCPQETRQPAPCPQETRQPAPCPQETRHPAPCPQETRHPAPCPQETRQPALCPQESRTPAFCPQETRRPAPCLQETRHPAPCPQETGQSSLCPQKTRQPAPCPQETRQLAPCPQETCHLAPCPQELLPPAPCFQVRNAPAHCTQIDHWAQRFIQSRKCHREKVRAACTIQAAWQGQRARRASAKQQQAAVKIQALFRGFRIRRFLSGSEQVAEEPREKGDGIREAPQTPSGHSPHPSHPKTQAVARDSLTEPAGPCDQHRAGPKPDGPAIFVKRNPCYNPRKVTIHVKAAAGDMS